MPLRSVKTEATVRNSNRKKIDNLRHQWECSIQAARAKRGRVHIWYSVPFPQLKQQGKVQRGSKSQLKRTRRWV